MAENKKSVLLYCDIIHTVEGLNDKEAGRLFKHYLRYINDLDPVAPDKVTQLVFEPIKQALKRDLKKWEQRSKRNSEIAKEGWVKRKDANACERIKPDAKNADSVIDNDKVKVIEINNVPDLIFPIEECMLIALRDERWVGKNKVERKDLEDFNGVLEGRGQYTKKPVDYKSHYFNWVKDGRPGIDEETTGNSTGLTDKDKETLKRLKAQ